MVGMIGHESIVTSDAVRCSCGHVLIPADLLPDEIVWSSLPPHPGEVQWRANLAHEAHIAELADRKLYGFDGDEYLQPHPEAVYETWECDNDPGDDRYGSYDPLEIIEWSVVDLNNHITPAWRILERIAEDIGDECGYEEAAEAADKATRHPDVLKAAEALRSAIAAHFTGWLSADARRRVLTVTWDENGEPLLDGEPMYRKVAP